MIRFDVMVLNEIYVVGWDKYYICRGNGVMSCTIHMTEKAAEMRNACTWVWLGLMTWLTCLFKREKKTSFGELTTNVTWVTILLAYPKGISAHNESGIVASRVRKWLKISWVTCKNRRKNGNTQQIL